jgi:hypothetical protein
MTNIAASLKEFGADPAALHLFDKDGPDLLPYATLIVVGIRMLQRQRG